MERKNDALGRTFTNTEFVTGKDQQGNPVVMRIAVSGAPREYTIAGRYTVPLTDKEALQLLPVEAPSKPKVKRPQGRGR